MHAGGSDNQGLTYLNAQETFDDYYDQGYRYFEYDLMLSLDGRIIATHNGLNLDSFDSAISYEEFIKLKLSNGMTPVNEEWLMETIMEHPDIVIIVDAKMASDEEDAKVLERLEELESIYNYDISKNIIPEVFSKEMWDIVKDTTSFDKYFFSHYKVDYTIEYILENFNDERIYGIAFDINCDDYFASQLDRFKKAGKKLFVFTITNNEELNKALSFSVDGIYIDNTNILKDNNT